jgi:hypothetical protein
MRSGIFIGLMSGLASAVLFYSAARGGLFLQLLLFILTPLPMMIVGLSFGWRAAVAAALAGAGLMATFGGARFGVVFFGAFCFPAILCAWVSDLGRRSADGQRVAWLPAGDVLAVLAIAGGVVPAVLALINGGSFANMKPAILKFVREFSKQMETQLQSPPLTEERIETLSQTMIDTLPGVLAAYWMILFSINLYLAGRVARTSGLLIRPWPDLHRLTPPPWMLLAFVAALFLWMTQGFPKVVGTALAGSLWIAFLLLGLSVLHAIAHGRVQWVLWLAYAALLNPAGPYAMLVIATLGLIEPLIGLRERFARPSQRPQS